MFPAVEPEPGLSLRTLAQAPLIEVMVELRWDVAPGDSAGERGSGWNPQEARFFPGYFAALARQSGFGLAEFINPEYETVPHFPTIRFRKAAGEWPCIQIGAGILTVNQVNDGYEWKRFKASVLESLRILNESYPGGIEALPVIAAVLTYRDGFTFEPGEDALDFLRTRLRFDVTPPRALMTDDRIGRRPERIELSFGLELDAPMGTLAFDLREEAINGRPGFILDTSVESPAGAVPLDSAEAFARWLDAAHDIQRHAFRTVIDPAYTRKFE